MTVAAGVGFKPQHFEEAIASPADDAWFEVHAENYMVKGGPRLAMLDVLRKKASLSLHGVGLSLASDARPDHDHLLRLLNLADRFEPFLVSEHLAWSRIGNICFPDLLPFPRTREALDRIGRNVEITQEALGRSIAVENPSLYLELEDNEIPETEFLAELTRRTGCSLLVDVNNVYVSANNLGFDAVGYLDALPADAISEIHLAGHSEDPDLGPALLIDSHDAPVAEPVWELYRYLIGQIGPRPTLIERDGNVPSFAELMVEREKATILLDTKREPSLV
ncbi:MAG: DUF692 domain-containing protein [Sphingomonadales bacterium]|nr:DUF692 domain-containing protein [Sphingomonadales bacterium]